MNKKYLITSALPYVNAIPHIGNFVGSVLPADVYARFMRAHRGASNVLFACGADAHGSPIIISAKKEGMSVPALVEKYHSLHSKIFSDFNVSFDGGYGTTNTQLQKELVQGLFARLDANGFIEERETIQPYGIKDEMFLADRQVEGTCPKCGFESARGDQCDKCCSTYEAAELINARSAVTGGPVEMRPTKNLFYLAHRIKPELESWLNDTMEKSGWPRSTIAATKKYLTEQMPDPSVTRDLNWGIPVNKPGYENKVFYVWFDAPWGYVSISQAANKDWARWWKGGDDCKYVQFMGKDNIKFHSIFFPGQEIALDDGWKKVDLLKGMNFLNFEGDKISKSNSHGIFLDDAIKDAPADCWRYALMASAPETDDTDFTIQRFADIVNKDLNGMLGNFVSRVCKMTEKNFGLNCPPFKEGTNAALGGAFTELAERINGLLVTLTESLDACEFRKSVAALREMWAAGNEFMTKAAPWDLVKTDKDLTGAVLDECFQLIDFYARVSAPFIPAAAEKMINIFATKRDLSWPEKYEWRVEDGEAFSVPENLFVRIDDTKIAEMTEKYVKKSPKIVVAKILTAAPHPNADNLQVLSVDAGGDKPLEIVCGAPNARAGMMGVLALVGAKLPVSETPLSARKVRGIVSNGMMCAADELGIGTDHAGILELPEDSVIGKEFTI
ncbi:MAG: methionine--tRNA ligase [Alphaproteobacteria bacterium]|nr:methionine--tRNA ligase [Alphaproteobacteria bacterium]